MKKILLYGLAIVLFMACQEKGPERFSTTGPEVDLVKNVLANYESGDWDNWIKNYADTAKIYYNSSKSVSANDAMAGHRSNISILSKYKFDKDPIFFEKVIDDKGKTWVNFWGYWKGTLSANDKELEVPVHVTFNVQDGKIVEEHGFWDNLILDKALRDLEAANAGSEKKE